MRCTRVECDVIPDSTNVFRAQFYAQMTEVPAIINPEMRVWNGAS
jgi:hypothetical protein